MKKLVIAGAATFVLSGCVSIFLPKKQKITIITNNPETTVYIDKEEFGKGSSITGKTKKDGAKQLVIKTQGYKDQYAAIVQTHRPVGYWLLQIPNLPFIMIGIPYLDAANPKGLSYDKVSQLKLDNGKIINRGANDKYIDISSIKLDIKNKNKDINDFYLNTSRTLYKDIETAEKERMYAQAKAEDREAKKKKKSKKMLESEDDVKIKYDDTKFSTTLYRTLRNTGFVDTVNKIFADNNNSLVLEASIKKVNLYTIFGKRVGWYKKSKIFLTWYVKNSYGEVLDSVETSDYSGDFVPGVMFTNNFYEKLYGDAIENSYMNLHKRPELTKHLKMESNLDVSLPALSLSRPSAVITDKADAGAACVILKTKKGHGSGFAITNDVYIVTN